MTSDRSIFTDMLCIIFLWNITTDEQTVAQCVSRTYKNND